ncbi:MAG: transposase [Bradyrhizobium sp.]|nr:transposase [Bradyrhizobium sp.]
MGCWAPKEETLAIEQTSGRQRLNIHGGIDLESGQTRMMESRPSSLIDDQGCWRRLRRSIRCWRSFTSFSTMRVIYHAQLVQEWLAQPGRGIQLNFIPPYCPHLNPIERLGGGLCTST